MAAGFCQTPRPMELDEYRKMFEAEERHFWFRGSRAVVLDWVVRAVEESGRGGSAEPGSTLRIVDVGAGTGGMLTRVASHFGPRCQVLGVEYAAAGVAFARSRGLQVVRGGLPALPLRDGGFDLALSMDVFEHVEGDVAAMAAVRRALRPGGRLVTTVPALRWLWSEHDEALHHFRRYHRAELLERLRQAGFKIRHASYYNGFLLPPIAAVRVLGRLRGKRASTQTPTSDVAEVPEPFNGALAAVFASEAAWLRHAPLPVGASLIVDAEA